MKKVELKPLVEEYTLADGRTVIVLRAGAPREPVVRRGAPRLRHGHELREPGARGRVPVSRTQGELENKVYDVPAAIDDGVARVKLETLGIAIDTLTEEQIAYMSSWNFETL